jgi:hypothetical protein
MSMGVGIAFILFACALVVGGVVSWLLSRKTYLRLKTHESTWPVLISVIVFLVTFAVLIFATLWLINSTVRFER